MGSDFERSVETKTEDTPMGAPTKPAPKPAPKAGAEKTETKPEPAPTKPAPKPAPKAGTAKPAPRPAAARPTPPARPAAARPTPPARPAAARPTPPARPVARRPMARRPMARKPAPKAAPPPVFETGISAKLVEKFGEKVSVTFVSKDRVGIRAGRDDVHQVAEYIRDELNYDHVESVSGVDYPQDKEIEVVYHIGSYTDPELERQILVLSTRAQREEDPIPGNDATRLPSLRDVFYSVEFHEREVFEMFGVYFEGHPDNRRLLLPEDWADLPPLRTDFAIKGR